MKIAAIFRSFHFIGGSERLFLKTINLLEEKGHIVDVFIFGDARGVNQISNITPIIVPYKKPYLTFLAGDYIFRRQYKILSHMINNNNYDLVFFGHIQNLFPLLGLIRHHCACYFHEPERNLYDKHIRSYLSFSEKLLYSCKKTIKYPLEKKWINKADCIIANSKYTQNNIKRIYNKDSVVIYPAVDISKFTTIKKKNNNIIFIPGRIDFVKNQILALDALLRINPSYEIKIYITGYSINPISYKHEIFKRIKKLKEKGWDVQVLQYISDQQYIKILQNSLVTLYPARYEPFGMVPIESMACGTPVIALKEGGPMESIIHNKTGFLSSNQIKEYKKYIQYCIDNPQDAIIMGKNGRKLVERKFTWDIFINKLQKVFASVLCVEI